jgi:hypothetical protein
VLRCLFRRACIAAAIVAALSMAFGIDWLSVVAIGVCAASYWLTEDDEVR